METILHDLQEQVKTLKEQLQKERRDHHALVEVMERNYESELAMWKFTQEQDQLLLDSRAEQVKDLEERLKDKDKKVSEPQPENEPQPEKVSQTQLEDSPLIRGMDPANALAAKILFTRGNNEFVDHVFTDQDTGRRLSYGEMRMRYG